MSKIHSPYVVQYVESGKSTEGNVYWIVMELLHGEDLNSILENDGPLSEGDAIKVVKLC
jgi:serine/threonine protein kinase